ncbi:2-amino-4-hydroxy-6-hydroxymethyldihydropteridine diphosphokinase [Dokdonella sp.]|uniref:2-amino-4-hydroxy-6- hydroxymethyldihydropteridine diphosphokinase n=1 Tax=Dokdonella sp. TaxID=2291710 RepID=UPI0025C33334|nr:2-amino-4-hydroxy-6-hydroxymethyldihydropteridine diphosphokinase [Dokdonella sp.]MBX3690187.1 2-amino-4-hydroxy-6-hydroxymethyldihydropteridine diphosphokinase [Dokdonella sp.]
MSARYLLLLGSTRSDDGHVRAALHDLANLGAVKLCAPIQHGPGSRDPRRMYFNALAELEFDGEAAALVAALKAIEAGLGRQRGSAEVAIDIDLLARWVDARWLADPHALAKGEFVQAHTRALLGAADIDIDGVI